MIRNMRGTICLLLLAPAASPPGQGHNLLARNGGLPSPVRVHRKQQREQQHHRTPWISVHRGEREDPG
jgi:hypothetical protein